MNILYICDEYPPGHHGGIGTSVRLLAREMVKQGHNVIVAGLYSPGYGGQDEFIDEGVKVYRFKWQLDNALFNNKISRRILHFTGITDWDIKKSLHRVKDQLEQLIAENNIEIIEMPDYNDYIRHCRSYIPFPKLSVPVVVKMNGSCTYFAIEENRHVADHILKMEQTILNQADAVASVSKYTAVKSAEYFQYAKPIEVISNGIDTNLQLLNTPKNPNQVIFTGTLVQKKGIYQLAKAWNIVSKNKPEARLLILGKGPQNKVRTYLTDEAFASVSFFGYLASPKLYKHLQKSTVSVFPSYAEAFALAPLEAMACGTAVINSNRTSGPGLVDDKETGLLIDPDNVEQLALSILYLLNNPADCERLAQNGNKKVKEIFDISKIAAQNLQFYNAVLRR